MKATLKNILSTFVLFAALPLVMPSFVPSKLASPVIADDGPVNAKPEAEVEDNQATITLHSNRYCPPCSAFVRDCKKALEEAGWKVVVTYDHSSRTTPTFIVDLPSGDSHRRVGYRGRSDFMKWLKSLPKNTKALFVSQACLN